jgi:carbamoyltransferase
VAPDGQNGSLLGPRFSNERIEKFLDGVGARYRRFDDEDELCEHIAARIADGMVVGWMQGRMEFGPRALGCRSIIGDARSEEMQKVMNLKIKFRESFRPFAPSVLTEKAAEYFEMQPGQDSPYMLLVAPVRSEKRTTVGDDIARLQGLEKLNARRSEVPAITHVDYSARVQTVDAHRHGRYHKLIERFEAKTGCPVIINTSFNVRGEPIVCSPEHAYHCFMATNMDILVLEDCVLLKSDQPQDAVPKLDEYLAQFQLD